MKCFLTASLLLFCGLPITAGAATPSPSIRAVTPQHTLVLEDGSQAVFAGIVFPEDDLVARVLASLPGTSLPYRALEKDRYGRQRILAPLEESLLRDGIAVRSGDDGLPAWKAAETVARHAHRGVWAKKDFVLSADAAEGHRGEFHVVEGTVRRIYHGHVAAELNFGEDWHSDFSVTVPHKLQKDLDMDNLEGARVSVRGTLTEQNGPMLVLGRPGQLEVIHGTQ